MTQPAESVTKVFHVMNAAGVPVTGLVLASFTITAYLNGVTYAHSSTITEKSLGWYAWTYNTAVTSGQELINIQPVNASYRCCITATRSLSFSGEVEDQDLDSLYVRQARPSVTVRGTGTLGEQIPITLSQNRYRLMEITIVDQDDVPILLNTDYNNWTIAVRSADQTTTEWEGTVADVLTVSDSGLLTIEWPEDASFFAALATGAITPAQLYWEVTGDLDHDTAKTVSVIPSSSLLIERVEVGT